MIDCLKYLNGNQTLLTVKPTSQLSYTIFNEHIGYLGDYVWQYGELGLNNSPDHELA